MKLDFDNKYPQKRMSIPRIKYVVRMLRLPVWDVRAFRTKNGVHVFIRLKKKLHPVTIVLIQSLMGSDYARETYNMLRVYNLLSNPKKYSKTALKTWNVLYYKKLVNGKVSSRERFDAGLTNRLRRELMEDVYAQD